MSEIVQSVKSQGRAIVGRHLANQAIAMVDFPAHQNVGDSLIYLGLKAHFRACAAELRYVCDLSTYDERALRQAHPDGPIVFNGGGNLGDDWLGLQLHREKVLAAFPDRKVVQLPQSVHFASEVNLVRAQRSFERHPDLTLLMRDAESLALAQSYFSGTRVEFCPDGSFGLGGTLKAGLEDGLDVLLLLRMDHESVSGAVDLPYRLSVERRDWERHGLAQLVWRLLSLPQVAAARLPEPLDRPGRRLMRQSFERQAEKNLSYGISLFSRPRVIVTDRLHGLLLAVILGKPVVFMDNSYGKVSAMYRQHFVGVENVVHARQPSDVPGALAALGIS